MTTTTTITWWWRWFNSLFWWSHPHRHLVSDRFSHQPLVWETNKTCARQRSAFLISSKAVADCARNSLQTCPGIQGFMTLAISGTWVVRKWGIPLAEGLIILFPLEELRHSPTFGQNRCDMLKRRVHVCRLSGRNAVMKAVQMLHVRTNLEEIKNHDGIQKNTGLKKQYDFASSDIHLQVIDDHIIYYRIYT